MGSLPTRFRDSAVVGWEGRVRRLHAMIESDAPDELIERYAWMACCKTGALRTLMRIARQEFRLWVSLRLVDARCAATDALGRTWLDADGRRHGRACDGLCDEREEVDCIEGGADAR